MNCFKLNLNEYVLICLLYKKGKITQKLKLIIALAIKLPKHLNLVEKIEI